jgi:Raf kinase inhibitor-like YbhB/YbcL family protein
MSILFCVPCFGVAADNSSPGSTVKLIFIHHSTGGNWLADSNTEQPWGGLGTALKNNYYYVSATNYGWGPDSIGDSTDIPNWPDWFTGTNSSTILSELYSETGQNIDGYGSWSRLTTDPGGENEIIMFKSCFPNSDLSGTPTDAAGTTLNSQLTVSNAKAVYNNLLTYFQTKTDKLFIVITAPPQNENDYSSGSQTAAERSANARAFNNWLVNDWLDSYSYNNVAVFDYFNVLTATDNHHRWQDHAVEHVTNTDYNYSAYPTDDWDSHPNSTGQQKATTEFVDLLNYFYIQWKTSPASSSKVNITQIKVTPTDTPQTGTPIYVTVDASSSDGKSVYYKFYYCANYGTSSYSTTPWTTVQDYSTTNSAQYTFSEAGSYIIVVRAVTDTSNEPVALPIVGQVVNVGATGEVNITKLTNDLYTSPNAGDKVIFTTTASTSSSDDIYYKFSYCANYGTSTYAGTTWTTVQDYSTANTCQYTFPSQGDYIMVVNAVTDTSDIPTYPPIIGQTVSVGSGIQVTSTAFTSTNAIPQKYTCDDQDISPPLAFANIPSGTQSLALICDDPDAPSGNFIHWVLFNLPASTTSLSESIEALATLSNGAKHGTNDFGTTAYGGPCPPSGTHRYYFKVYALDTTLSLAAGATKSELISAMSGHILSQGQLMGTYSN